MSIFLLLVVLGTSQAIGLSPPGDSAESFFSSLNHGMKQLEEASKKISDMLAMESKMTDKSREEIEDMLTEDNPDGDASISQESEEKAVSVPKEDKEPEDEDSDEDDDDIFRSGLFNIFKIAGGSFPKPWYTGPNVCIKREEKVENSTEASKGRNHYSRNGFEIIATAEFNACSHDIRKTTCVNVTRNGGQSKISTVTYECCHGFARLPGKDKCQKVVLKKALELAEDLGAKKFADFVKSSGLEGKVEAENVTVFLPTDVAFEKYQNALTASNQIDTQGGGGAKAIETNDVMDMINSVGNEEEGSSSNNRDLVMNHLIDQVMDISDMRNTHGHVIKSESGGVLRLYYYPVGPSPVATINCARLNATDRISTNGIVHTIDGIITPALKSVQEILSQPQYSKFKAMLEEQDLWKILSSEGQQFTVMAVSDSSFEKMGDKLNTLCLKKVLQHHILPHGICSVAASQGQLSALDLTSSWLSMRLVKAQEQGGNDKILFDSEVSSVAGKIDMMATNGLVHEVESLIVPNSAKFAVDVLKSMNSSRMVGYLEKAGLVEEVTSIARLTLFVPSEEYLEDKKDVLDAMEVEELKQLLRRHMAVDPKEVDEAKEDCDVGNVLDLISKTGQTLVVRPPRRFLEFMGSSGKPTVDCVPLVHFNSKMCNGVMHEIAAFIPETNVTLLDTIHNRPDLKLFTKLLADTKLEEELKSLKSGVTVLAPVDSAFQKMRRRNFETLAADKEIADQVLRNHIIPEVICCSSLGSASWPFTQSVRTLGSGFINMNAASSSSSSFPGHHHSPHHHHHHRDHHTAAYFAGAGTHKCDIVATDGVLHTIDSVIMPTGFHGNSEVIIRRPNSDIVIGGF